MAGNTDMQNAVFSRIAYFNLEDKYLARASRSGGKVSLSKLLTPKQIDELRNIDPNLTMKQLDDWKIVGIHDTNDTNGFSACVIETSPGQATVAFRGSEDMFEGHQNARKDWADADFRLLDSVQTRQQAEAERFLNENRKLLARYDSLSMTGHSLGGNLAEYATLVSEKYGLDGRIKQCVSLDGPGFNKEFHEKHRARIEKMNSVMTHYQWSLVGRCLTPVAKDNRTGSVKSEARSDLMGRHSLDKIEFGEDGGIVRDSSTNDPYNGALIGEITRRLDQLSPNQKGLLVFVFNALYLKAVDTIVDIKDTFNTVKQKITDFVGYWKNKLFGGSDAAKGAVKGAVKGAGSGAGKRSDRLLVPIDVMQNTLRKYNEARTRMNAAARSMDQAWDRLSKVWDGGTKAVFVAKWVVLMGNVKKSERAMERSINGLTRTVGLFTQNESDLTSRANSLDPGVVPPLF